MTGDEEIKGFAGLASLVSNIDEVLSQTQPKPTAVKASGKARNRSETKHGQPRQAPKAKAASHSPSGSDGTVANAHKKSKSGASRENWFWGLIGVGVLILLFYGGMDEGDRSPAQTPQSLSTPESFDESTRAGSVEVSKPPVGDNNVLSLAQLRWCLREDIRIDTLRPLPTTNAEVGRFNSIVSDYNSRCASFRYSQGTLERARRDIEAMREDIAEAAYQNGAKVLGRTGTAVNRQEQNEPEDDTFRPETSAYTRQPAKTTSRDTDTRARGCVYKDIMTDADYIACGLTPPGAIGDVSPSGEQSKELAQSAQDGAESMTARLGRCEEHYNADRLTTGASGTALECYRRALEIDPGNAEAVAGLNKIADKYALWARTSFQRGKLKRAKTYLNRLETVDREHPILDELREAMRAPERSETDLSKVAKVYYLRRDGSAGRLRNFEFLVGEHTVGQLGVREYLFFYTYPQVIRGPDDCQLTAQAGKTYYLSFHLKADESGWACRLLKPEEAVELLDTFSESEDFTSITAGTR